MTEEQKASDATRFLVVMFEAKGPQLLEGESMFAVVSSHAAEGEAGEAAKDLAMADQQDRTYGVFQKVGTAKAAREVTWKGARG